MDGRSFCPLGDAAAWALRSNVKLFREEFEQHVGEGRCPFEEEHLAYAGARPRGAGDAGVTPQPSEGIDVDGGRA
jgi:NADH-quinone oxidoreductase subunit F